MGWSYQGPVRIGLLVFFVAFSADARECKINCHGSSGNILRFEPGKVYNYAFQGLSVTTLGGVEGDVSRVGISANVQISALSSCEHALKVTNVQTYGSDNKKYTLDKLSLDPIKFGLQNGRIESEICTTPSEDEDGLDIKRAALSLIQSSVLKDSGYATYTETDVFGVCPTGFEFSKSGGAINVVKTRDLNKCAHREDITLPFLATPYYVKSDVQSSSLLTSTFRGEQKYEGGILKSGSIEEKYQYGPGPIEAEAKVVIKTSLNFVNSVPGAIPAACNEGQSIIFEQGHSQEAHGVSNKIVDLVRQGCDHKIVDEDTAGKFSELVRLVAIASKADILNALQHVKSGPGIKERAFSQRMLLDAVIMAQSASSVEVMADILKKKEVTGNTARMWLLALGAVKHASRSSLSSVLPLLDGEPDINAYLGIGSLAGKYCREHTCEGVNEVNQLQIKLGAPLLQGCRVNSRKEEDHIIASLKGLGNIKYLGPKIAGKIIECVQDENVRRRIRVAGLETIASDPNKEQFKNLALNILKNVDEDSEIRIKAYQVLAKCPCGKVAGAIKDLLSTEQSNQVGGYIVSHLRSLHASTNPDKAAARHHLANIIPPRRFTIDPRRYSLNQELSYSADLINTGASGEFDIIYSQNSFVPRSLSLNLTTQLFGTAYNLLEIDARAENLDLLAEKILGPRGYVKANEAEDIYEDARNVVSSVLEKIASRYERSFRPKRSISRDQLNNIASKVQLPSQNSDEAELDLSLKVLGSEVSWTHLFGSDSINPEKAIDAYFSSMDSLVHTLKNADVDYRRHITFIDREVTYPTGMGLGLQMNLLGSGVVRLKADGKFDVPAMYKDPKNTDVRFQIMPSAAINIGAEVKIKGVKFSSSVKVAMDIHTSTGADLTFRVLNGRGVDVKLGLPIQSQEIISVQTKVFTTYDYKEPKKTESKRVHFKNEGDKYAGCFDQLSPVLGLTFCGEFSMPQPDNSTKKGSVPPINLSAKIKKDDDSLTMYHFKAYYDHRDESDVHSAEVLFDTPNTKINRKMKLNMEGSIRSPKRYVKVDIETPFTEPILLEANMISNNHENSINGKLRANGEEYTAKLGAKATGGGNKIKYEPVLEYKVPEASKSGLIGKKGGQTSKQAFNAVGFVTLDRSPEHDQLTFQGLGLSTQRTTYSVDGTVTLEKQGVDGDLKVSYEKEHVGIKGKARYSSNDIHGKLEVSPSQYPDVGISLSVDTTFNKPSPGDYDSKVIIVHGPDPNSETARITIINKLVRGPSSNSFYPLTIHHEIKYPVVQLEAAIKGQMKSNKSFLGGIRGKMDKYSTKLELAFERDAKQVGDYKVSASGELMGKEVSILSARDIEGDSKSRFINQVILIPGGTYSANALVTHKFESLENFLYQIDADASIPKKNKAYQINGKVSNGPSGSKNNLIVKSEGEEVIKVDASFNKKLTGFLKLDVPKYAILDAKTNNDGTSSNSVATLTLPKVDRKMEAKADFILKAPKYSGIISICYDTKDPSKTLKIQTDNEVISNKDLYSVDSRNVISLDDTSIQISGKGKSAGGVVDGSCSGEVELILPNGYNVGSKFSRSSKSVGKEKEAEFIVELFDHPKGEQPQKVKFIGVAKHIDLEAGTIDGQGTINYVSRSGQDANAQVNFKKMPKSEGKTSNINGEVRVYGALVEYPSAFKIESEVSNEYFELDDSMSIETDLPLILYKVSANVGQEIKIDGNGKLNGPVISIQLSGNLPENTGIKNFKIISNNNIDINKDDSNELGKIKFDNAVHWNDNRHVAALIEGELEENGIEYVLQYETDSTPKRRLSGSAHYSTKDKFKGDASVNLNFDGKSADLSVKGELNKEKTESTVHILVNAPQIIEDEKVDIVFKNKIVNEGRGFHTELAVSSKSGKATAVGKVEVDPEHPLIEISYDHPSGKSRLFYKADKKGERHWTADLKAKWTLNGGGSLSAEKEVNLQSVDNFIIKADIDGTPVENKKLHLEVANRPAKGEAKKITILAKSEDKVIFSGSTNYNYKDEGDVAVLEGSGTVKYKDQTYPLTFQATKQRLENGLINKLNAKAGKMSLNVEQRFTPDEFFIQRVFCKEPKSCSKAQISSKLKTTQDGEEQNVVVILDLSTFNQNLHDIIYKSAYKRHNLVVDNNVELQWAHNSKIKSHTFVHENAAGMYISLPKRTIGGEIKYDLKTRDNGYTYKFESDLYINKEKEPKLGFLAGITTLYEKGVATTAGEVKLTHPSLGKDLAAKAQLQLSDKPSKLIDGALEIDVSPNPENKIIGKLKVSGTKENINTLATLKSKGCNIDLQYEEKIKLVINGKDSSYFYSESFSYVDSKNVKRELLGKFEASGTRVLAVVKLPEIVFEGEYRFDKGYTGSHTIFGRKYAENLIVSKDSHSIKYQLTGLEGGKSLSIEVGAKLGGNGVVKATFNNKNACSLDVALDESNFLKSQYAYDTEVLKSIYSALTKEVSILFRDGSKSLQTLVDRQITEGRRLLDCLSKARPNFSGVEKYVENQLKEIKEEIEKDKTIQEAVQLLKEASGVFGEQFVAIVKELIKFAKTLNQIGEEAFNTLQTSLKELQPKVEASLQRLSKVFGNLLEQYLKLSVELVDFALDKIKEHEKDIKDIATAVVDFVQDIGKVIGQTIVTFDQQLEELIKSLFEQLKEMPIVTIMQEKFDELKDFKIPEEILNLLHELVEQLNQLMPTNEASQFVNSASSVLEKILKREEIKNKDEVFKKLYKEFVAAVKSLIALVAQNAPQTGLLKPVPVKSIPLVNFLRGFGTGGIRLSIVNLLTSKDFLPSIEEFTSGLKIYLDPIGNIPPFKGQGFVLGGTEIITFDGVHLGVPASCSYILAEDYKDRNFSIVGQIANGALKSLTFSSQKDSIEITASGNALVNGKQSALPAMAGDLKVWKNTYSFGIWSQAGVLVQCSDKLVSCAIEVDGFYFGKLRGLLGNLNGEKYDERLTPEGKIVQTTSELANNWKLDGSCGSQSPVGHKHTRNQECTRIFSDEPVVHMCRPFVDPAPFRDACDHLAANTKTAGACLAAKGYVHLCRKHGVIVAELPDVCATCDINGKTVKAGDTETVTQGKAADIVIVAELLKDNEFNYKQIASPLVASVKSELAKAGVNDVRVFVVGGGSPRNPYASFFTNAEGECAHDPASSSLWFDERPIQYNETIVDKLKILYNYFKRESGHGHGNLMYKTALETPFVFRPNAYRLLLGVNGKHCPGPSPGVAAHSVLRFAEMEIQGVQFSIISPFADVEKDDKEVTVAALSEKEAIGEGGEPVEGASYLGKDLCVHIALETGGHALASDVLQKSPKRNQIIQTTAAKIVSSLTSKQLTFDCDCSIHHGIFPHPDCHV